ncbi:MAG: hypothetical protein JOZ98_10615 [Solirubrobacterales bacterium]|nr:hypothetical protein [Solirubrobacterales bacterium]MBV9423354.1 hypothetical protein [Solirubrobacterales bacterium]
MKSVAVAVWDFIVGDDWVTALGVVAALGVTAVVAATGAAAWWVMPVAVIALLLLSLRRAAR